MEEKDWNDCQIYKDNKGCLASSRRHEYCKQCPEAKGRWTTCEIYKNGKGCDPKNRIFRYCKDCPSVRVQLRKEPTQIPVQETQPTEVPSNLELIVGCLSGGLTTFAILIWLFIACFLGIEVIYWLFTHSLEDLL